MSKPPKIVNTSAAKTKKQQISPLFSGVLGKTAQKHAMRDLRNQLLLIKNNSSASSKAINLLKNKGITDNQLTSYLKGNSRIFESGSRWYKKPLDLIRTRKNSNAAIRSLIDTSNIDLLKESIYGEGRQSDEYVRQVMSGQINPKKVNLSYMANLNSPDAKRALSEYRNLEAERARVSRKMELLNRKQAEQLTKQQQRTAAMANRIRRTAEQQRAKFESNASKAGIGQSANVPGMFSVESLMVSTSA
jgi:hypothetical protein